MVVERDCQEFEEVGVGDGSVVQACFGTVPGVTLERGDVAEVELAGGDVGGEEDVWHGVFLFGLSMHQDRFKEE